MSTYHYASKKIEAPKPKVEVIETGHSIKTVIKYPEPNPADYYEEQYYADDDNDQH